jgi:hydroxypyruvate reductase
MKQRILQHSRLMPWLEQQLAERYDLHPLYAEKDTATFLKNHGAEFTGLATTARFGADKALLDALPNLKVISSFGVGYETYDLAYAKSRGLQIGYTPDVLNDCVADTAWGLLMDVARRFTDADRFLRRGDWLKAQYPLTTRVSGKKLGIVGLGRIGRVVAKRSSGFDMEVRYHNRRPVADVPYGYEPTLNGLAQWADFLVVISAGGPETRHLINAEVLQALGSKSFLISVSRGSVIDEQALIHALQNGVIAGAGLDVYQDEPNVPAALTAQENAVLLPHVASATNETRRDMAERVLANFEGFYATGIVPVAVPL